MTKKEGNMLFLGFLFGVILLSAFLVCTGCDPSFWEEEEDNTPVPCYYEKEDGSRVNIGFSIMSKIDSTVVWGSTEQNARINLLYYENKILWDKSNDDDESYTIDRIPIPPPSEEPLLIFPEDEGE